MKVTNKADQYLTRIGEVPELRFKNRLDTDLVFSEDLLFDFVSISGLTKKYLEFPYACRRVWKFELTSLRLALLQFLLKWPLQLNAHIFLSADEWQNSLGHCCDILDATKRLISVESSGQCSLPESSSVAPCTKFLSSLEQYRFKEFWVSFSRTSVIQYCWSSGQFVDKELIEVYGE